jgi:hypothetical protein
MKRFCTPADKAGEGTSLARTCSTRRRPTRS